MPVSSSAAVGEHRGTLINQLNGAPPLLSLQTLKHRHTQARPILHAVATHCTTQLHSKCQLNYFPRQFDVRSSWDLDVDETVCPLFVEPAFSKPGVMWKGLLRQSGRACEDDRSLAMADLRVEFKTSGAIHQSISKL